MRRRLTALRHNAKPRPSIAPDASVRRMRRTSVPRMRPRRWTPGSGELLELIVARPECIESARSRIAAGDLAAAPCRRIFETCCRLADEGVLPTFDRLMLEFDEPAIQSLLVDLDKSGQAKGRAAADPEALLADLVKTMTRREIERRRPAQIVSLREGGMDDREQAALLEEIIRQKKDLK